MFQRSSKLLHICRSKVFPRPVRCNSSTEINSTDTAESNSKNQETRTNSENGNEDLVQVERYGPVTIIALNRTQKRNAINQKMAFKICEAITNFENDESSTVGVIHGVGGSFCSGYDIDDLQSETLKLENLMNAEGSVVSGLSFNDLDGFSNKIKFALRVLLDE